MCEFPVRENPLHLGAGFLLPISPPAPCGVNAGNISVHRGPAQTGESKEQIDPLRGKERPRRLLPPGHEVIEGSFQLSVGRKQFV